MSQKKDQRESGFPMPMRIACVVFLFSGIITVCMGIACSQKSKEDPPTEVSFLGNEAVRIMDTPVTLAEFMLYTVGIKTPYKEEIAESIRIVKVLCAAGEKYGISLSEEEEAVLKDSADSYYDALMENGVDGSFLTSAVTNRYVREQYLSEKVYGCIKEKHAPAGEDGGEATELTEEVMDEIAELLDEYDGDYRYQTSINWELLNQFQFYEYASGGADPDDAINYLLEKGGERE